MANSYDIRNCVSALQFVQDFDGGNFPIYIGEAEPGSLKGQGKWRIRKMTYDGSGKLLNIAWANNDGNFDKVWDDRASYDYDIENP